MAAETLETDLDLSDAKRRLLEKMLSGGAARKRQADGVAKRSVHDRQPMSLEQQNVWLHSEMAPGQPLYNEPITIHRRGSFDLGLMEKSFNEVLRRHEAWRTSFQVVDGETVPVVHDDFSVRLPLVDLTGLPAAGREAEALRLAKEDALTPIDLGALPLFRARVFKLAEDDHRLHLTLHHIIFDGVSLYRVVVPELSAIYDAYACGRTPLLDPPGLQYGDYAIWRERHTSSDSVCSRPSRCCCIVIPVRKTLSSAGSPTRACGPNCKTSSVTFSTHWYCAHGRRASCGFASFSPKPATRSSARSARARCHSIASFGKFSPSAILARIRCFKCCFRCSRPRRFLPKAGT
jgi:hypothetical protein